MKPTTLALLFVVIVAITATLCAGRVGGQRERCLCKGRMPKRIRLRNIKDIKTFNPSASCLKTEILITVNSGMKVCLDPEGQQGKKILNKSGKKSRSQKGKKQRRNKQ